MSGKLRRIRRVNMPGMGDANTGLEARVRDFIVVDLLSEFSFVIEYITIKSSIIPLVVIKVFYQTQDDNGVYSDPVLIGVYSEAETKRFKSDIARVTKDNPAGDVELAPNILYNGMFNSYPETLDGWVVDSGNDVKIVGNLNRLEITSSSIEAFEILNNKTQLDNLTEYEAILNVYSIGGGSTVNVTIGTTPGAVRSAKGVYTENIISGGNEVMITGDIATPDTKIILEYLIVNVSNG